MCLVHYKSETTHQISECKCSQSTHLYVKIRKQAEKYKSQTTRHIGECLCSQSTHFNVKIRKQVNSLRNHNQKTSNFNRWNKTIRDNFLFLFTFFSVTIKFICKMENFYKSNMKDKPWNYTRNYESLRTSLYLCESLTILEDTFKEYYSLVRQQKPDTLHDLTSNYNYLALTSNHAQIFFFFFFFSYFILKLRTTETSNILFVLFIYFDTWVWPQVSNSLFALN